MEPITCSNPQCPKAGRCNNQCLEQLHAELAYPEHSPEAALSNYRAGREIYDTNGDLW